MTPPLSFKYPEFGFPMNFAFSRTFYFEQIVGKPLLHKGLRKFSKRLGKLEVLFGTKNAIKNLNRWGKS